MFYFANRQLKQELRTMDELLTTKEMAIENAIRDRNKAQSEIAEVTTKSLMVKEQLAQANKEIKDLKKLIREQTGADLLVNALRELGVVPKSEKSPDSFNEAARLQERASSLNNQSGLAQYSMRNLSGLQGYTGGYS